MWKLYPVLFVSAMLCSAESLPELRFHAPGSVMLPGEKIVATLTPGGRTFHWSILDWQGKTLRNGTALYISAICFSPAIRCLSGRGRHPPKTGVYYVKNSSTRCPAERKKSHETKKIFAH